MPRGGNALDTDHHEVQVGMEDFFNALPKLVWHEDEPITWPSSVSLYFVSKLAREQVKVVLTGEGAMSCLPAIRATASTPRTTNC